MLQLRLRAALAAALAAQLACTSSATVPLQNAAESLRTDGNFIELVDDSGDTVQIAPESDITFITPGGQRTAQVEAGLLCRMQEGIAVRPERGAPCASATPLIAWGDIAAAEVETFDGAGSVAITAGVVVVVAAAVIILAGGAKSLGSSGAKPSGGGAAGHAGSAGGAGIGHGGTHVGGLPGPGLHGGGHFHVGPPIIIVPVGGYHRGNRGDSGPGAPPSEDDGSLFSRTAARRATVRGLVGVDGGGCLILGSCLSLGVRGGMRLFNLAEITLGLRALQGFAVPAQTQVMPVLGLALHGEFPAVRNLALAIGAQAGTSSGMSVYVDTLLGVRFSPARGLWLGLYPARPAYVRWTDNRAEGWVVKSSVDLAYDF